MQDVSIVKIDKDNFHLFLNMVYWRIKGLEKKIMNGMMKPLKRAIKLWKRTIFLSMVYWKTINLWVGFSLL